MPFGIVRLREPWVTAMNVWRRPGRRAAAAPVWRRVEDGVKRGSFPVHAAIVPVQPNPGGARVREHRKLGVGCDVDGGGEGAVGGDGVVTNGAGSDSISSGRSHGSPGIVTIAVHPWWAQYYTPCTRIRRGASATGGGGGARVVTAATNPSPASAGSPARPPHESTKKMVKPVCALMAREAENGIHDPMKGGREAASEDAMVSVARIAVRREEVWGTTNRRVPELVDALSI
ncbi:hypothetical protein OsI_30952 [Oryza sativa Indica Group]|uniref:Uncharacterized protein n=1 Tax=Oryza sativa subsp. indica TaxID=39946 RepID=B8BEJ5_ORYSI|nr:hypothetical protein OsI_30952 [Oryza sativa Indica Group]